MLWYIAVIAILNLCLGYLWAAFLRPCPRCAKIRELSAVLASAATANEGSGRPATTVEIAPDQELLDATTPTVPAPIDVAAAATSEPDAAGPTVEPEVPRDPATGLVTREHAEHLLAQLAETNTKNDPVTVALVEIDQIDWIGEQSSENFDERLLCGVSIIVRESLADNHTAARFSSQQLLLVVPHEDVHQATRRTEELRQRIATTEFVANGRSVQTTVTCALVEVSNDRSGKRLMEFLQEALGEAKRYGGNRTFMHDGNSPTPVVPPELDVAPQQLAI